MPLLTINHDDSPYIRFSYDWNTISKSESKPHSSSQDVDSGTIVLDQHNTVIDESYYGQLATRDGSIQHRSEYVIGGDLIPQQTHKLEQVDIQLDAVNYAIHSFFPVVVSPVPLAQFMTSMAFSITQPVTKELTVEHFAETYGEETLESDPNTTALVFGQMARGTSGEWNYHPFQMPVRSTAGSIRDLHQLCVDSSQAFPASQLASD